MENVLFSTEFERFSMDSIESHKNCRGFHKKLHSFLRNERISVYIYKTLNESDGKYEFCPLLYHM